jgi:choline dehydrogenase-like flavoprotein
VLKAAGASVTATVPANSDQIPVLGAIPETRHVLGGMQMGTSEKTSVTDPYGRVHGTDNVYVADGGVFATSGGHNPTLTIMAVALRIAKHLATSSAPSQGPRTTAPAAPRGTLAATGSTRSLAATAAVATAAGLATRRVT